MQADELVGRRQLVVDDVEAHAVDAWCINGRCDCRSAVVDETERHRPAPSHLYEEIAERDPDAAAYERPSGSKQHARPDHYQREAALPVRVPAHRLLCNLAVGVRIPEVRLGIDGAVLVEHGACPEMVRAVDAQRADEDKAPDRANGGGDEHPGREHALREQD